jgi:hypothetical protein
MTPRLKSYKPRDLSGKKTLVSSNTLAQEFNAELNTGHHVRMDLAGTTHVLSSVIKNDFFICKLVYANDSTGEWAFTTVVSTPGLQSIRSSALSLDSQGTPHVVYMTPTSLVYAHRVDETWQHETVFLSNNLSGPLSLTIDLDGNPIVGFLTFFPNNAGHLWKKNNLAWAPLATFPGAYHSHTHRIDSLNRIHTALVKVFPPQIHYARLAPDGSIQREMDVPVSGVTMDSRLDLALDQADVVYIVAHDVMVKINSWDLSIILCPKA